MNIVVLEIARSLASIGHSVTLISAQHPEHNLPGAQPEGVSLLSLSLPGERPPAKNELPALLPLFAERLVETLDDFDVIHSHYWLSAAAVQQAMALRTTRGLRNPAHLASLHTIGAEKMNFGASIEPSQRVDTERTLAQTVPLVANSRAEAQSLEKVYGVDAHSVPTLTLGVDTARFRPRPELRETTPLRFAVVGRIQAFKAQDFALEVFAEANALLAPRRPHRELELVFAGEPPLGDEKFAQQLRERASELGVDDRVQFAGALNRSETAALLASATVTIIPSLSETFGMVALESAACATPVLAGAVGGLNESVADSRSGILMHNRDARQWAQALVALIDDDVAHKRLQSSALEFAMSHSWSNTADELAAVYTQLMSAQR
jgi:D-inositol-3-phosphate glycosyltransferase